jgi:hypothetical protein
MTRHECQTCRRYRLEHEFLLTLDPGSSRAVKICRPCRVKLWDNPDDPYEINGW